MKLVYRVDKINLKLVQVPVDALECSVCAHWKPRTEFCNGEGRNAYHAAYNAAYSAAHRAKGLVYRKCEDGKHRWIAKQSP